VHVAYSEARNRSQAQAKTYWVTFFNPFKNEMADYHDAAASESMQQFDQLKQEIAAAFHLPVWKFDEMLAPTDRR
jgi:hypothetical protein